MKPSIGRIVLTKDDAGNDCPAIVCCVHSETCVSVWTFPWSGEPEQKTSLTLIDHENLSASEWCWPPRV